MTRDLSVTGSRFIYINAVVASTMGREFSHPLFGLRLKPLAKKTQKQLAVRYDEWQLRLDAARECEEMMAQ